MAYTVHHLLLFLVVLLPHQISAQRNGNITIGLPLIADDEKTTSWLSPSGDFAFGFLPLADKDLFLLSIWYYKIPEKTVVWYADKGNPASRGSKVELTADLGLVMSDPEGREVWNSILDGTDAAYGFLNDTGNLVLIRSDSVRLWESFKNPTDTILPTQILETDGVLVSRLAEANFSQGRFQLRLLQDGNLVLNTRNEATNYPYEAYYISGTRDPVNSSNSGYKFVFDDKGLMFVLRRNDLRSYISPQRVLFPTSDFYNRATLDFNGVFTQYYHPKTSNGSWTIIWSLPDNICLDVIGNGGSGACGYNSVCRLGDNGRPICECPQGYSLVDPNDRSGSCKPRFLQTCGEDGSGSVEELYDIVELTDTDWPLSDYEQLKPYSTAECKYSCLHDCFCAVAIHRGDSCWKKKLPLSNGRQDKSVNGKAFLKFKRDNITPEPENSKIRRRNREPLILVGSVLLGSSVFVNLLLIGAFCVGFFMIYPKKAAKLYQGNNSVISNLQCFTFKDLSEATEGFKEELGRGSFGIVYKGTIHMGTENVVAVKRLNMITPNSDKEFETELEVIGKTHHKNLVRLLGFCNEGENRLLVYEYMNNGTLASFLFGKMKPSWKLRSQIALGISRGLLYLHEECIKQIIHCDIKPQNILLDEYYNARIADFGLAKLLMINQSQTNTGIRGTKGYVAPEWFKNNPITGKVDVYSFGVLLLEVISCRKCLGDRGIGGEGTEEEGVILTDLFWDCFQEGKLSSLVENDSEALNDQKRLERFVMVGLWCIQDDPLLRPTIRNVNQMLEGVAEVAVPPCPLSFTT